MDTFSTNLPILVHAYVPRQIKVGPVVEPDPTPWHIAQRAQQGR